MRIKPAVKIPVSLLKDAIKFKEDTPSEIAYICTDSRICEPYDLFIPLAQKPEEAAMHIKEAKSRGALIPNEYEASKAHNGVALLLDIASAYKQLLPSLIHTVGITGSVGKTTVKNMTGHIVSQSFRAHITRGNFNNHIGLPITLLSAPIETEVLILEMGMNHTGEISRLSLCSRPDISVITNIGTSHIGNLGSQRRIAEAKLEIMHGMTGGTLLYPHADPFITELTNSQSGHSARKNTAPTLTLTFSVSDKAASYSLINNGFEWIFLTPNDESSPLALPYAQPHLLSSLLTAMAASHLCGVDVKSISEAVLSMRGDLLRHKLTAKGRYYVLNDAYNASCESVIAAFDTLSRMDFPVRSALLGDILEAGEYAPAIHTRIGEEAGKAGLNRLYLTGEFSECIRRGAISHGMDEKNIFIIQKTDNLEDIATIINDMLSDGEVVLIKASHGTGLHKVAEILEGGNSD